MSRSVLIFKRDPAVILAFVAAAIQSVSAFFFHLTVDQQAGLNGAAAGILGLVVAFMVHDNVIAAVTALFQALIALSIGFGAHISADRQSVLMVLLGAGAAAFVRTQVTAKVTRAQLMAGMTRQPSVHSLT